MGTDIPFVIIAITISYGFMHYLLSFLRDRKREEITRISRFGSLILAT